MQNVKVGLPAGTPKYLKDSGTNDSDKVILTVPAGKVVVPLYLIVRLNATATVGNRRMVVSMTNGVDDIWASMNSASVVASSSFIGYYSTNQGSNQTTVRAQIDQATLLSSDISVEDVLPEMYLLPGYTVRVRDAAAVDAAADDMITVLHYVEYDL